MLAEVLGREVGERAEPHGDARHARRAVGVARPLRSSRITSLINARSCTAPPSATLQLVDHGSCRRLDRGLDRRGEPLAGRELARPRSRRRRSRPGSLPSARASSIASPTPKACVDDERKSARGIASSLASKRCSVPASAPDATASTTTAVSAPSHASISRLGSCSQGTTSTPSGTPAVERGGHREPDAVVAAQPVADADHDDVRRVTAARPRASGSASRTRCTGRSCGSSARRGARSSSSPRSA